MAQIPAAFIEEVRQKTNIVDVIEPYVQLKKSGRNLFGLCPFHEERTPSFSVSEEKQIFHCFSCGRGGNVFKFLMEIESLSFPEAVIKVAEFSGLSLPVEYQAAKGPSENQSATLLKQDYQAAQELYHHILMRTQLGETALNYLHQRQLTDATLEHFQIGFAPDQQQMLLSFFQVKQKETSELARSGLFTQTDEGKLLDRFRDRVIFPVQDQSGDVIAFSGRILQKPDPQRPVGKYLNSPETEIFNKSKTLFNLAAAKKEIRQQGEVILFEGFMDVISAYQAGVKNGVASMGTSLTEQQVYLLQRITQRLIICYDGDAPGLKAACRALELLQSTSLEVGVVILPQNQDPDEFIKSQGAQAFSQLVHHKSLSPEAFMIEYLSRQYNLNNDLEKVDYLNAALAYILPVQSPVQQKLYVEQLAQHLNLPSSTIRQELQEQQKTKKILTPVADYGQNQAEKRSAPDHDQEYVGLDSVEKSERNLLNIVFHYPEVLQIIDQHSGFHFVHQQYQDIFDYWVRESLMNEHLTVAQFVDLVPADLRDLIVAIEMMPRPDNYLPEEVQDYITNIEQNKQSQQLQKYQVQVKQAKQIGDSQQELELTKKMIALSQQMDQAKSVNN